jgi:hypothetical protein
MKTSRQLENAHNVVWNGLSNRLAWIYGSTYYHQNKKIYGTTRIHPCVDILKTTLYVQTSYNV